MTFEDIEVTRHGDVELITLNRPDVRNALRFRTYDELERAVRTTTSRCLVITGADPAFCSGDDVRQIMGGGESDHAVEVVPQLTPAADALLNTDVPIVAAVNGAAVGWGMELALMADIRVASERAKFGELFVLRGLCTDVAGIARLANAVGRERAAELLFTGDVIDAATAGRLGLVSRVVPHETVVSGGARHRDPYRRQPAARSAEDQTRPPPRTRPRLDRARHMGQRVARRALQDGRPSRGREGVSREARTRTTRAA